MDTETAKIETVYKIVDTATWAAAEATGTFHGAGVDHDDGFIHLSTAAQVAETLRLHFRDVPDLLLIGVRVEAIVESLRWEASRRGHLFPHLYAPLDLSAVCLTRPISSADTFADIRELP